MDGQADEIVARARGVLGTQFRAQGRDPAWGLDCVGVIVVAAGPAIRGPVPRRYPLRGGTAEQVAADMAAAGLRRVAEGAAGDVVLAAAGPRQMHLAVLTERGFIHADAGLRRVVEVPGAPPWPVLATWRIGED